MGCLSTPRINFGDKLPERKVCVRYEYEPLCEQKEVQWQGRYGGFADKCFVLVTARCDFESNDLCVAGDLRWEYLTGFDNRITQR